MCSSGLRFKAVELYVIGPYLPIVIFWFLLCFTFAIVIIQVASELVALWTEMLVEVPGPHFSLPCFLSSVC